MMLSWFQRGEPEVESNEPAPPPRGATRQRGSNKNAAQGGEAVSFEQDWWWRPLWTLTALVVFAGVLLSAVIHLWDWLDRPVTAVKVVGKARHLDRDGLAQSVAQNIEVGLLATDIGGVKEQVQSHPWVRGVQVIRDWPETLEIRVEEEVPVARWGETGLLNHEGEIFWPELKPEYRTLPRLSGSAADTEEVMAQFHDLNQMFRRVGLRVVGLDLEARGAWTLLLDNQIQVVVGRSEISERLERFLNLYTRELAARAGEIELVDIRYANGVAVRWKTVAEESDAG